LSIISQIKKKIIAVEIPNIKKEDVKRFIELLISFKTVDGITDKRLLLEFTTILGYNESASIDFGNNIYSNHKFLLAISESGMDDFYKEWGNQPESKSWFSFLKTR
jgi:hypothetical protein